MKKRYTVLLLAGCILIQTGLYASETRTLRHDGRNRSYLIHVPASYNPASPTSLVLGLHGAGNTAEIHEAFSQLSPIADREGFIAVYPNATPLNRGQVWNTTSARSRADDVGFISTLIDTLSQEYAIDPNRVYVFGNSSGAFMAHHLGARLPYKIASIASCAGLLAYGDFMEGPPVSVILFHGDNDNTVPYEGYPEYGYPGAEGSAALWAQWNGCDPEPEIIRDDAMTLAWQWSASDGYGDVVLYRVKGLEHTIPLDPNLHAGETAWSFFSAHPKMTGYINEDGPIQNLTTGLRYNSMQSAIYYAHNGDEIVFAPGTYQGGINLTDKDLILRSEDPNNPSITEQTIIQGNETSPVITFNKNDFACQLAGLTITGGQTGLVLREASPRIEHCRIIKNAGHGIDMQAKSDPVISNTFICTNGGTGVFMTAFVDIDFAIYNEPEFINCTIAQNAQAGIHGGMVTMRNGIVYGNGTAQLSPVSAVVSYSCIQGGYDGLGNIDADPLFAELAYLDANGTPNDPNDDFLVPGDYHLKSQAERFDPNSAVWVLDEVTSPCIDAGDPNDSVGNEPDANGGIINMGAYGGTVQASRTFDGD